MIEVDSFTGLEQHRQAKDISDFITSKKVWLKPARPDIWKAFHKQGHAISTLTAAAMSESVSVHLLRKAGVAVGIARIVQSLEVVHPGTHEKYEGRYIEYLADVKESEHDQIARDLATHNGYTGSVLAALRPSEAYYASGIWRLMEPVGRASWLEIERPKDVLSLAPIHDLQLYRAEI